MSYVTLFEKIRWASEESGLSVKRIAERAGVKPSTLHEAMRRNKGFDYRLAIRLAKELKVSADWLLDDEYGPEHLGVRPPWLRHDHYSAEVGAVTVQKAQDRARKESQEKKTRASR